jgi:hypothetical protein
VEGSEELELPDRYHAPGCPADPDRLEWHETTQGTGAPNRPPGTRIEVIRCADCGGQIEKPIE